MRPLVQEISSSSTPESLVEKLRDEPGIVLLRSAFFDSSQARYSFLAARPFLTFRSFGSRCELRSEERTDVQFGNPWHLLDSLMSRYELLEELDLPFVTRSVRLQTRRNDPCLLDPMIKNDQGIIKSNMAVWQFQVVERAPGQFRFDEVLQIIAPITETSAQWKRQIQLLEQFIARHQAVEQMPRIAELNIRPFFRAQLAARAERAESQEWTRSQERITRLRRIEECAPQQHDSRLVSKLLDQRLGSTRT